ncbi:MAG: bactofilin family protein [Saprospiraceae bacterium]
MSNTNNKKAISNNIESACVIVKGTIIEGEFKSTSDTRMDGVIKGNVDCSARMIIGKDAKIEGNVKTKQANIAGSFFGELEVQEQLVLSGTANVDGTVSAKELSVEDGAMLNGNIMIGK